jgi:competence ComEA-like helix-hairpin-helix protein
MAGPTRNRFDELLADPTSKPGEGSTKRKARKLLAQGGTTPEAERQKLDERVNDPLVDIYPDLQRLREGKPLGGEWADKFAESEDELQRKLQAIAESNLPDREKERLIDEGSKRLDKPFWMDALDFIDKPDAMARSFLNQVVRQFDSDDDPMWNWSWDGFWKGVDDNISWNEILANRDLGFTNYILGGAEPMRGRGNAQAQDNPDGWGGLAQGIFTFFLDMATSPTTYLGGAGKGVTRLAADKGLELSRTLGQAAKIETELGNALEANRAATLAARSFEVGGLRGLSQAERKGAEAALRRANLLPTDVKNLKGGAYLGVGNARVLIPGSRQVAAVTTRPLNVGIASLRNSRAGKTAAKPFSTVFRQLAAQIQSGDQARVAQAMETQTQLLLARADSALWMTNANAELDEIVREIKRLKVDPEELSYFLEDVAASAQGLNPSAGKLYVQYTENPKVQKLVARIQDWQSQTLRNNFNDIVGEEVIDDLENYVPTLMSKDFLDLVNKKKPVTSIFTEADWQRGTKFRVGNEYLGEMIVPTELHPKNFTPKMQGEDILRRNYGDEFIGALYDRNWIKAARTRVFVAQGRLEGELIARNMRRAGVGFTAEQIGKMASPIADMGETMRRMNWQQLASKVLGARQAAMESGVAVDTAGTRLLADIQVLDEIVRDGGTLKAMTDRLDETGRFIADRSKAIRGYASTRRQLAERIRRTESQLNTSVGRMVQRVKQGGAAKPDEQAAAARLTAWAMGVEPDDIARLNVRMDEVDEQLARYMGEADLDAGDVARIGETVNELLSGTSARLDTVNELLKTPQASIGSDEILRRTKLQAEKVDLEENVAALRAMRRNLRATDDSVRDLNRIRDGFDAEVAFEQGRKRILENTTLTSAQKRAAMRQLYRSAPPTVRRAPYGRALDRLIEVGEKGRLLRPNGELAEFVATPKGMRLAKAQGGVEDLTIDALSGAAGREAASEFIGRTVYYSDDAVASGMDAKDIRRIQVNVAMKNPRVIAGVDDADRIINAEMLLTAVDAKLVQLDQLTDLTNTQQVFVDEISAVFARHAQAVNAADGSEAVLRFIDDLDDTLGKLAFGGGTPSGPLPGDPAERLIAKMRLSVAATPNPIAAEFVQRAGARIADQGLTPGAVDEIRRQLDDLEVMVTDNSEELLLRQYDRIDELKRKIEAPAEPAVADEVAATADDAASEVGEAADKVTPITSKMLDTFKKRDPGLSQSIKKASKRAQKEGRPVYVREAGEKEAAPASGYFVTVSDPQRGSYIRLNPDGTGDVIQKAQTQTVRQTPTYAPRTIEERIADKTKELAGGEKALARAERSLAKHTSAVDEWDAFLAGNPTYDEQLEVALRQDASLRPKSRRYTLEEAKALPRDFVATHDAYIRAMVKDYGLEIKRKTQAIDSAKKALAELASEAQAPNTAALPASEPVRGPGDVPLSPSPQVDEASQALLAEQREIVNEVDEALDAMFDIDARYADDTTPNFFWNGFDLRTDEGIRELKKVVDAVHNEVKETLRSIPLGNKAQAKALKIPRPGLGFIEDYIPDAWRKQPGFNQAFPNYEGGANDDWWFDLLPDSKKWNSAKRELEDAKRSMQGMSRGHPDYKKLAANKAQASKRVNALRKNLVDLLRYSYFDEADGRWLPNRDNLRETGVLLPEHEMAYLDNIVEGPSDEAREAAMAELEKRAIGFGFTGLTPNAGVSSVPFDQAFTSFVRDSGGVRLVDQLDGVIDPNDTSTWWDVLQYRSKAKDAEEKQIDYLRRVVIERKTPGSGSDLYGTGRMIADEYNRELADVGVRLSTLKQVEGLTPMLERWRDFASDMPNSIRRFVAGEADPELKLFFQSLNAQSPNRGQLWRIANELYLGRLQADEAASAAATAAAAKETEKLARNVRLQRLRKSGDDSDRLASAIETTILARGNLDLEEPAKLADEYVNLVRSITGSTDAVDERFLAQLKSSPTETMTGRVAQLRDEAVSADLEIGELVGDVSVMAKEVAMREAFVAAIQRAVWGETISGEELAALGWRNSQTVTRLTDLANQARTLRGEVANIAPPQKLAAFMLIDELVSPAMTSMSPKRAEELLAMSPGSGPLLAKLGYTPEMVGAVYRSKLKKLGYDGILVDDLARRSATVFDEKQVRPASKVAKIEAELETLQMQARKSIRDNQRKLISLSDQAFGFRIDRQSDKPADALAVAADNMKKLLALDSTDANSAERLLRIQAHEAFSRADDLQLGRTPTTQDAPAAASDPMDISFSMQNAEAPSQLPAGEGSSVMGASALRLQGQAFAAEADMLASGRGPSKLMDGNLASTPGLAEQIAAINDMGFKQLDRQTFAEPWLVDILVDANRLSSPAEIKKLLRAADYATNVFKGYAILSPGFHIRNFFGGLMNNWLAGVDVRNYVNFFRSEKIYFAELRKTGNAEMALQAVDKAMGKKGGDAYRQWHRMESASGMGLAGAFAQDAGRSTSTLATDKAGSFLGDMGRAISAGRYGPREQILSLSDNALIRANGYAAQRVERFLRGSLAYDTFYTRGGDLTSATLRVRKYHFDYNDVSAFEANYLRRIIPFYVWISRNVPLQIEGLIRKPKVALSYYRLKNAIEAQSEEDAYVSSWYGREGAIRLPFKQDGFNRYLFTELPLMDLGIIDSPMEYLTSAVTPYLKVPVELAANKRFFTNQPFRNELVELPPKYEETKVAEALVKSGLAERGADGVARIDERYLYTMEQGFPLLGVLNRLLDPTRAANTWLSKGLGFTIRTNDDRSQNSEIRRRISWLNDEGDKYQSLQYDLKETSRRSKTDNTRRVELNAERLLYERDFLLRAANTYDAKALADLPEISENAARWIVANRATNGSFKTLDDIVKAKIPDFERTNINSMLLALAEKPETMGIPKPKVVDLNSSGIDELEQLPGVGPSTAKKIIDYRRTYGGFKNIDDLRNIKGLSDADVDAIRDYFLEDLMKRATPEYRKYMQQAGYRPLQELVLTP